MKKSIIAFLSFLILITALKAQDEGTSAPVYVKFEPVKGASSTIGARTPENSKVRVGDQYTLVNPRIFNKLKRRSCATFEYDILPGESSNQRIIKAKTKRNAFGFTASYFFYGREPHQTSWIRDSLVNDFGKTKFKLSDYSVGLYFNRQLCGKNRHRLSMEISAQYRHVKQMFTTDSYHTTFNTMDPDGMAYTRHIDVSAFQEKQMWHTISVPLAIRYDLYVFRSVSLFIAAGIDNNFIISNTSDTEFDAVYAGQYGEDLFNLYIDQNGYYDFGKYNGNAFSQSEREGLRYTLYGVGTIGLQLFLGKTLSLEIAGTYYRMLYSNVSDNPSTFILSSSSDHYQSMRYCMRPFSADRIGANCKLKFSF